MQSHFVIIVTTITTKELPLPETTLVQIASPSNMKCKQAATGRQRLSLTLNFNNTVSVAICRFNESL